MKLLLAAACLVGVAFWAGCAAPPPHHQNETLRPLAAARQPAVPHAEPAPLRPASVDLRAELIARGLTPRPQGGRGTCSIFTACSAFEFALAKHTGVNTRMSPEYLNWAGAQAIGQPSDGNFFHNAIAGWEQSGLCADELMPYQPSYDPARMPSPEAAASAAQIRAQSRETIAVHWIVPWVPDRFGVDAAQFDTIKEVLASGYPVAAGSGHSRLLVGYRDDPAAAGGGVFITEDSALNRFDEVTYDFVRTQVADAFWVQARSAR